jgi:hypothetical protein
MATEQELRAEIERLEGELMESHRHATKAMRDLNLISTSAKELAELLREKWNAPADLDAMTLYCASLMAGFAAAWQNDPPENGFVHSVEFKDIGRLMIEVRREDGKSVVQAIREVTARAEAAEARVAELQAALDVERAEHEGCGQILLSTRYDLAESERARAELQETANRCDEQATAFHEQVKELQGQLEEARR